MNETDGWNKKSMDDDDGDDDDGDGDGDGRGTNRTLRSWSWRGADTGGCDAVAVLELAVRKDPSETPRTRESESEARTDLTTARASAAERATRRQ